MNRPMIQAVLSGLASAAGNGTVHTSRFVLRAIGYE